MIVIAVAWKSYLFGFVTALLLVAAVLTALEKFGATGLRGKLRLWPSPPSRVKFKSLGGTTGSSLDSDGRRTWDNVRPDFAVRNDGPAALYELEAGAENPRGRGVRLPHPQRIERLAGEGTQHRFGGSDQFRIPAVWLDGYEGQAPEKELTWFVAVTDEDGWRWEAKCRADANDNWVALTFRRVSWNEVVLF